MKKLLSLCLILLMLAMNLFACAPKAPGAENDPSSDPLVDPYALDPSIPYQLSYTSNGDGTCSVTGIIFNSQYRRLFDLIIPEKSPEGDTVTRIAWGDTIDSVLHNRCPVYVLPEDLSTACTVLHDMAYEQSMKECADLGYTQEFMEQRAEEEAFLMVGPLKNFYKVYDISEDDGAMKDAYIEACPISEYMPIARVDVSLHPRELSRLAIRLEKYSTSFVQEQYQKITSKLKEKGLDEETIHTLLTPSLSYANGEREASGFANCSLYVNKISIPKTVVSVSEGSFENLWFSNDRFPGDDSNLLSEEPPFVVSKNADETTVKEFFTSEINNIYFEHATLPEAIEQQLGESWKLYLDRYSERKIYWYFEDEPGLESAYYDYAWHYVDGVPTPWHS